MSSNLAMVAVDAIAGRILTVRGQRALLDRDLAALYDVPTGQFNQAVKRNSAKFPGDFMFQLTSEEWESLRSQFVILKTGRGEHPKYLPHVFTEHGALMASAGLNSARATEVSLYVVRAFVQLRRLLGDNQELARRIDELEKNYSIHDAAIASIFATIREMIRHPEKPVRGIGFV